MPECMGSEQLFIYKPIESYENYENKKENFRSFNLSWREPGIAGGRAPTGLEKMGRHVGCDSGAFHLVARISPYFHHNQDCITRSRILQAGQNRISWQTFYHMEIPHNENQCGHFSAQRTNTAGDQEQPGLKQGEKR